MNSLLAAIGMDSLLLKQLIKSGGHLMSLKKALTTVNVLLKMTRGRIIDTSH
jgi:hypothetical protein